MLTLTFRPLPPPEAGVQTLEEAARQMGALLADLAGAAVIATVTPVLAQGQEAARHMRWQTHNTRHRLVLETTWHHGERLMMIDAHLGALPFHRFTALYALCRQAAAAGYQWAGTWKEGAQDPLTEQLGFRDAATWFDEGIGLPPYGRRELGDDRVLEWLHPSPRIMKRLVYFAEDCRIDWESLIVEDLMTETPATYLELRQGRNTVALARVLRECYLPGMEGYDPRSRTPPVQFQIESFEVHPDHRGRGYGALLVAAVQALRRPVSTLDTYRRAEKFWERMRFVYNQRRSAREDSNIFEWAPATGRPVRTTFGGEAGAQ